MAQDSSQCKDRNIAFDTSEFNDNESEPTDTPFYSGTASDYIPSETSDDRAFVISDSDAQLSSSSDDEVLDHLDKVSITRVICIQQGADTIC